MRMPDWSVDGWCLDDGEEYHAEAPSTFEIPSRDVREMLQPGDYAKLIFRIAVDNEEAGVEVERMWVIIRERHPFGYVGILDNEPFSIAENDSLWAGTELPFEFRHIIAVDSATPQSAAIANAPPAIPWQ